MTSIVYLDQNAWVTLAKGAWDKTAYPSEHSILSHVVDLVRSDTIIIPLSFANIYETLKINIAQRRINIANTQSIISNGLVFHSRRRILRETLASYLAGKLGISHLSMKDQWYLSDLWFDAGSEYSEANYGFHLSDSLIDAIRQGPSHALFDFLTNSDEDVRLEAVRRYTTDSLQIISQIENRRRLVARECLPIRKRAYGANLILDEIDLIFSIANDMGLSWSTVADIGSSLVRSLAVDVPVLNIERELAVRLEDQDRALTENDLRDMMSFVTVLPFADIMVAEKQFVNLTRQAKLDKRYGTDLLTSVFDLPARFGR
jgi:hypothetical protein